ncbi:MAG: hypothetical protein K2Q10_13510, partial [Rhodospirillales bacterium]|nr:hypothetical protein [Rhodospirillales bacterium]
MNGPRRVSGARALLFERLVDEDPERVLDHPRPLVLLDFSGLKSSIGRELERLFSTRVAVSADRLERRGRTVIDY